MPRIPSWLPRWLSTRWQFESRLLKTCTAGTPFRRINEKLGAETGDLAMTYKLVDVVVGLCRHNVRIGDGFSWKWRNGNGLWDLVVVRNLFARCGSSFCLVSTAAVGQQFVDREGGVFYVKMVGMFKKGHRSGTRSRLPSSLARC